MNPHTPKQDKIKKEGPKFQKFGRKVAVATPTCQIFQYGSWDNDYLSWLRWKSSRALNLPLNVIQRMPAPSVSNVRESANYDEPSRQYNLRGIQRFIYHEDTISLA